MGSNYFSSGEPWGLGYDPPRLGFVSTVCVARELTMADKVSLHITRSCVPCLFYTRKEDGCRKAGRRTEDPVSTVAWWRYVARSVLNMR